MPSSKTLKPIYPHVHRALRSWNKPVDEEACQLEDLLLVRQQIRASPAQFRNLRPAINEVLKNAIAELRMVEQESAQILEARFLNGVTAYAVGIELGLPEYTIYRRQASAIRKLSEIIVDQERAARSMQLQALGRTMNNFAQLERCDRDTELSQLLSVINEWSRHRIIEVSGLAGIGKTTLAAELVERVVFELDLGQVHWIGEQWISNIAPETLSTSISSKIEALRVEEVNAGDGQVCESQTRGALFVLDFGSATADLTHIYEHLWEHRADDVYLILSRHRTLSDIPVFIFPLSELSDSAAETLVHNELDQRGLLLGIPEARNTFISGLLQLIGGHPQALHVVCGLLYALPPSEVINELHNPTTKVVKELYDQLFGKLTATMGSVERVVCELLVKKPQTLLEIRDTLKNVEDVNEAVLNLWSNGLIERHSEYSDTCYKLLPIVRTYFSSGHYKSQM